MDTGYYNETLLVECVIMFARVNVQILAFILLTLTLMLQYKIVLPVETAITEMGGASLMFLPHGMKAVLVVVCGPSALLPIFFSHLITDLYNGMTISEALMAGPINVLTFLVPLALVSYLGNSSSLTKLTLGSTSNLSLFRVVFVVAFIASLINSMFGALRYSDSGIDLMAFRFVVGDMIGTIMLLILLMILKSKIIQLSKFLIARTSNLKS